MAKTSWFHDHLRTWPGARPCTSTCEGKLNTIQTRSNWQWGTEEGTVVRHLWRTAGCMPKVADS